MCTYFRHKFEHKEFNFGPNENVTFLVYVYDFTTPFWLQVSEIYIHSTPCFLSRMKILWCPWFSFNIQWHLKIFNQWYLKDIQPMLSKDIQPMTFKDIQPMT